jgi:predicted alpha/beta superfamily hydrolase
VGWSFGGMFGIYSLFTRPALFQHVIAVSPSLWWRDRYLMEHERAFTRKAHAGEIDLTHSSLTMLIGDREMPQEIQDARSLQLRLEQLSQYGLRSYFQLEVGEDHMSVPFRVTTRILDELLSTRRF